VENQEPVPSTRVLEVSEEELTVQQLRENIRDLPSATKVVIKRPADSVIAFEFSWKGRTLNQISQTWPDQSIQDLIERLVGELLEHEFSEDKGVKELLVTLEAETLLQLMSELQVRRIAAT